MRRKNVLTKQRKIVWRIRAMVALALTGTAFMTAMAVAGIGGDSHLPPERALARTIVRQRVAQGLPAKPAVAEGPSTKEMSSSESILSAVDGYEAEMNAAVQQVEAMKKAAYDAKDIIRVNYITGKLEEMKQVLNIVQPIIASIRQPGLELFVMQSKLMLIRQGAEELRKKAGEAASAQGDSLEASLAAFDTTPGRNDTNDGLTDPQPQPDLTTDVTSGRPAQASPYR